MKAGSPSGTARLIALATVLRPNLSPPGASVVAEQLLQGHPWLVATARTSLGRIFYGALERALLPGVVAHWLGRKRLIDDLVRAAGAEGFLQLFIIGAGLDTLPYRMLAESLFAQVVTADHPATLASLPEIEPRVERHPLDLNADDPMPPLSPVPTLIIIEGVLMYLPEAVVDRVLRRLSGLALPRTRLVASWMLEEPGRGIGFREQSWLITAWLRWRGEPMLWATTPEKITALLDALGWTDVRTATFGLAGEQLAIANLSSRVESPPSMR